MNHYSQSMVWGNTWPDSLGVWVQTSYYAPPKKLEFLGMRSRDF